MPSFLSLVELLFHTFWPTSCPVCGKLGNPLCEPCLKSLLRPKWPRCVVCGCDAPCAQHTGSVRVRAASVYASEMRDVILRLKSGEEALGRRLGRACASVFAKPDADRLVPVPLHLKSRRGYNQSLAIARGLGEVWGMEALDMARWSADFPTRMGMSRDERASLPEDAFVFAPREPGERVALVDDVVTTGSTLFRLSQAANRHGITVTDAFAVAFAS